VETARLNPRVTPRGRLEIVEDGDAPLLSKEIAERLVAAFSRGTGSGLLALGATEVASVLPPTFAYFRDFAGRYVTALCTRPDVEEGRVAIPPPAFAELAAISGAAPPIPGAEYLTAAALAAMWGEIEHAFWIAREESAAATVQEFLKKLNPAWNTIGRVHFNLAENRKDEERPFAFLATYTSKLSEQGAAQHKPLGEALREYARASDKDKLLSLLLPVQRAAESCSWLEEMVDAGEIFHPLRWAPADAVRFLGDVPALERAGVVTRMPAAWRGGRPSRPTVTATIGDKRPSTFGMDALLDFDARVTLDGEPLSAAEVTALLAGSSGLAFIRGQWVEVDRERLARTLARFEEATKLAAKGGLAFGEALRLLSGAGIAGGSADDAEVVEWSRVVAGPWLAEVLRDLRSPEKLSAVDPGRALRGTLRPYQAIGLRWLFLLSRLGLGAVLADDMGLGKTIQVLALLLVRREEAPREKRPSLLVAPASLLANWAAEIERFAPQLDAVVAHPSAMPNAELKALSKDALSPRDLVITSYGTAMRLPCLEETEFDIAILDEAQAIKNPGAKQTRAVKALKARARIALTGTPVENRLGDLWSIFDFVNPGLLGTAREFSAYARRLSEKSTNPYGPLRDLVRPYILRRLKTDKAVIADLPDKTELKAYCPLSRKQAALYLEAVGELAAQLESAEGIGRKGLVLSYLMRFKQICNHPSQWLGDREFAERDSGKWSRLRDLAEVIAAKQEKALVFTQFREMTEPLAAFLGGVFGRPGLVLHGGTAVKQRKDLVRRFQDDESVPFFVLSLKAGGTGLNLTAASHVVHFDRWWNPAVEDQATDRAFRIGQTRNVLVHKFVCKGTFEEKIDGLIEGKKRLSRELLEGGAEINLTELDDEALLKLVRLDLSASMEE
jgi:non-specific serine/threonine protein kinase